jgi:hypothetical protein
MLDFATDRPVIFRDHVVAYFEEAPGTATVEVTNLRTGSDVRLHSVLLDPSTPGVLISGGTWSGDLLAGIPVVIESTRVDLEQAEISGAFESLSQSRDELRFVLRGPIQITLP